MAKLSKQNYEMIAEILNNYTSNVTIGGQEIQLLSDENIATARAISKAMAFAFKKDNAQFDEERFLEACGVELACLCGRKGGTPIWKKCQGEAEHKRKAKMNEDMAAFHKGLPELAEILGDDGKIIIMK